MILQRKLLNPREDCEQRKDKVKTMKEGGIKLWRKLLYYACQRSWRRNGRERRRSSSVDTHKHVGNMHAFICKCGLLVEERKLAFKACNDGGKMGAPGSSHEQVLTFNPLLSYTTSLRFAFRQKSITEVRIKTKANLFFEVIPPQVGINL